MKKLFAVVILIMNALLCFSQHYEVINIESIEHGQVHLCADDPELLGVIIYGEINCPNQLWNYNYPTHETIYADSIVVYNNHEEQCVGIIYQGCAIEIEELRVTYAHAQYNPPINTSVIWKRLNETTGIYNPFDADPCMMSWNSYLWSNGETTSSIHVTEPGIYSLVLEHPCNPLTYSVEVRDNVELYRATVDLKTNKNEVTWQATPEQAEYIIDVKVYRDDMLVGTAPYSDGHFLDEIGSDAAARTYQIVGVSKEGDDCPIASYRKGTIHTTYYEDVDGNLNMTWNTPYIEDGAEGSLTGYQICKYDPVTEEITVVDQINPSITDYTCNSSLFSGGTATIAAIFSRDSRSFSNRNTMLAVNENENRVFKVYPNPSNGTFTVEGVGIFTIVNTLGQTVLTQEIDGETTIELPKGMYFAKMGNSVRKIVVE